MSISNEIKISEIAIVIKFMNCNLNMCVLALQFGNIKLSPTFILRALILQGVSRVANLFATSHSKYVMKYNT